MQDAGSCRNPQSGWKDSDGASRPKPCRHAHCVQWPLPRPCRPACSDGFLLWMDEQTEYQNATGTRPKATFSVTNSRFAGTSPQMLVISMRKICSEKLSPEQDSTPLHRLSQKGHLAFPQPGCHLQHYPGKIVRNHAPRLPNIQRPIFTLQATEGSS